MTPEPWEQLTDGFPDTPSGDTLRRIMATAGGDTIDRVIEAYRIRGRWLNEHPDDWDVIGIGSVLFRLYENRGGNIDELADLIGKV